MASQALVLIDTCIWVQFFNRPRSPEKRAVDELLDEDRAALVGPILTEILLGFRRTEHADWVASFLSGLHLLDVSWDEWRAAAHLGRELAARGHLLPLTDLAVAAVAKDRNALLYSVDPHFDFIRDVRRFLPS